MRLQLRKLVLTAHIVSSVGWLGAVAAFLALAVVSLQNPSAEAVHAADLCMAVTARLVIFPLCIASLLTGVIQSFATPWGLFRHHWVVAKLFITAISTLVLWVHLRPIAILGTSTVAQAMSSHLHAIRLQVAVDSGVAIVALLVATALGVFKPKGTTRFAARRALAKTG